MTLSSLLAPNTSNFHNLALFVCHLFIDGHFRTGHILHDPNIFDDRIISEVDSACPHSIPWISTDVTKPFTLPWGLNDRTDHILQLIFCDPEKWPNKLDDLKVFFTYYHLFIKNSNAQMDQDRYTSPFEIVKASFGSDSLMLHHFANDNPIIVQNHGYNGAQIENTFDGTFGWLSQKKYLVISKTSAYTNDTNRYVKVVDTWKGESYVVNFFLANLNALAIQKKYRYLYKSDEIFYQWIHHKSRKYYKEVTIEYKPIETETLKLLTKNPLDILSLDFKKYVWEDEPQKKATPLYPYKQTRLLVAFFYGADFQRQTNGTVLSRWFFQSLWIDLAFCSVIAMLCFMRRKLRLQHNGLISCTIDVIVSIIGGGTIRIVHKLERWFFATMFIAGIFISAIGIDATLFSSFVIRDQSVDTFEKLLKINPPIYIGGQLHESSEIVFQILRNRVGSNINYKGVQSVDILMQTKISCFAVVENEIVFDFLKTILKDFRDFDILKEELGFSMPPYFVTGYKYVPEQTIKKIDKITSLLMESGLNRFYESFADFLVNLYMKSLFYKAKSDEHVIGIEFLKGPLMLYFGLLGFASLIFIIEIGYFPLIVRLKNRRRNVHLQNASV